MQLKQIFSPNAAPTRAKNTSSCSPGLFSLNLSPWDAYSLSLTDFMKPFPNGWEEQRQHFGF